MSSNTSTGICRFSSCPNASGSHRKYCRKHRGGKPKCTKRYCRRQVIDDGERCFDHSTGNIDKICCIDGCDDLKYHLGLCIRHYIKQQVDAKRDVRAKGRATVVKCRVENCPNRSRRAGDGFMYCQKHLQDKNACVKSYCSRFGLSDGYCFEHKYLQIRLDESKDKADVDFEMDLEAMYQSMMNDEDFIDDLPEIDLEIINSFEFDPEWLVDF